jgi:phosphate acetyltransferase
MSVVPIDAGEGQFHSKYERLVAAAKQVAPAVTMVVHPCDEASLRGVCEAAAAGIIKPVLVGPAGKIKAVAAQFRGQLSGLHQSHQYAFGCVLI